MDDRRVHLYDTTPRDGAQTQGVDFSAADKSAIARELDLLGLDYVEGGWPGANPTDDAFFAQPPTLSRARLTAFGMTRRAGRSADNDPGLNALLAAKVGVLCIVGKAWDFNVEVGLGIDLDENVAMIGETIAHAAQRVDEVIFDAEHFFDGYKANPDYALRCLAAATEAGARWIVLCDTTGGALPFEVERIVGEVTARLPGERLGIHCHDDTGNAVANSLMAVEAGVRHVQGTLNGLGERCGNANLISVIPSLVLKMGYPTGVSADGLTRLSRLSHLFDERHIVVSDQSGRSNIVARIREAGIDIDNPKIAKLVETVKEREFSGYAYDGAEASFELLARRALDGVPDYFTLKSFRVIDEKRWNAKGERVTISEATVKLDVGGTSYMTVAEGNGPVNALDEGLRKVLTGVYPELEDMRLVDYKVRILTPSDGTRAVTRVMIESADGDGQRWSTVGVSANIIDASFKALYDSIIYKLLRDGASGVAG